MELYQLRRPPPEHEELTKPQELYIIDGFLTQEQFEDMLRREQRRWRNGGDRQNDETAFVSAAF